MTSLNSPFQNFNLRSRRGLNGCSANHRIAPNSGFTLVEVLVGSVILAVVMVSVFGSIARGIDLIEASRDQTRIAQIMQSELEDLRTLNWDELTARVDSGGEIYTPSSAFGEEFSSRYTVYRYVWQKSSDQLRLRVYVAWNDRRGVWDYDYFETWYTQGGMNDYFYRTF